MEFEYCQLDEDWKKSTSTLVLNNRKFHQGKCVKCKVTDKDGESICSRTGKPHVQLSGFKGDKDKGQYKTNAACPYPPPFCEYIADLVCKPELYPRCREDEPKAAVPGLAAAVK